MPDPLDVVAARIARLTFIELPKMGRVGPGPVLTVVRDTTTGKIYIGFNEGLPRMFPMYCRKAYRRSMKGFPTAKSSS
jgi:hypothetical protein